MTSSETSAHSSDVQIAEGIALLRELRVEIQHLFEKADAVRRGDDPLSVFAQTMSTKCGEVTSLIDKTRELMTSHPDQERLRQINACWGYACQSPLLATKENNVDADKQLRYFNLFEKDCRSILREISFLTVPTRIYEWFVGKTSGDSIQYHLIFQDEMPNYEDRVEILTYLANAPEMIPGVLMDVSVGRIYKYSTNRWKRALSLLWVVVAFLISTTLLIFSPMLTWKDWPIHQSNLSTLFIGWLGILSGAFTHAWASANKDVGEDLVVPPMWSLSKFPNLVNARLTEILFRMLLCFGALFALAFTSGVDKITLPSSFFIGFGLDSIVGSLGAKAKAQARRAIVGKPS